MKNLIEDPGLMRQLKARADELEAEHATRDEMFAKYKEMYLLDWARKTDRRLKHMQVTASPDFRNQVLGAVRLMVATDPQINVKDNDKAKGVNVPRVEEFLNTVLYQSGRVAGEPIHYPLITAGLLFDEMHAAITPVADLMEFANKVKPTGKTDRLYFEAHQRKLEEIAERTPFLIEAWSPQNGYPEFGPTGLTAYYRNVETTLGTVLDRFGFVPERYAGAARNTTVYLKTFYDEVFTAIWLDETDLYLQPHGLPRIPVVAQILNGSRLFAEPEDQRQPFGYTMLKSNLWNAQNLSLTAIFTAVFNQAWTPTKVYTPAIPDSQVEIDFDEDLIRLNPNDRLEFIQSKGLIDPAMREAYALATQKGDQSTIYPQALGAAIEGNATYSELALLAQSGRLPLIGPQRRGGWGMADICETILAFMREEPRYRKGTGLTKADLPRGLEVNVKLDVTLPQDKLQQANILSILTNPNDPKVDLAWALENILNVNNPEEMKRRVWNERASELVYQQFLQKLLAGQEQAAAAAMQGGPGGMPGMPGGPGGPMPGGPGGPGGMPPEMMQGGPGMMDEEGGPGMEAGPSAPGADMMQGGLPGAQAGMIPGQGQIMAGPEEEEVARRPMPRRRRR